MRIEKGATMEIKKCPFCGGEASSFVIVSGHNRVCARVLCKICPADITKQFCVNSIEEGEQKIIELWNRRVDDEKKR